MGKSHARQHWASESGAQESRRLPWEPPTKHAVREEYEAFARGRDELVWNGRMYAVRYLGRLLGYRKTIAEAQVLLWVGQ